MLRISQTQLLAQLNLTVNATYIPDDSSQTMVTLCGSGVGTAVSGTARITFMAPTTGNIPTITVASTTADFRQNDGSTAGSIAIAETVRGVVNSNVCAANVAALGCLGCECRGRFLWQREQFGQCRRM